ncbi:MAG TPA: ATP-binding cassette domain-containing protein, partial [Bacteroidales bacterium]|nr:ATP-binding cassette domain-containing protein [Bacteroidales bacterium]
MEKVIEIKNLSKAYERYVVDGNNSSKKVRKLEYVLKDINLDIYKSDVVGIIGPNGSGKSTLLKILSGITAPTEGEVLIIGKVASILELGVGFDMELSGYDNIFYGGRLLGFSNREIRQSIDKIIEFSGLEDYIYTPVKFYSSGMVMRLAYS